MSICLCMIVKDESHIIEQTLQNLISKFTFNYWIICDTGSTDDTKNIITKTLKSIPGELHNTEWKDFGTNRTQALELAYQKTDYVLMFDADDAIEGTITLPTLTADLYGFLFYCGETSFHRYVLFNNRKRWRYVGVLHEYAECMEQSDTKELILGDYKCYARSLGNRSKDPNKYAKDAEILKKAYEETSLSRYAFYCANSYKDCGKHEEAIEWYKRTLTLDNWIQEKYVACLRIYQMYEALKTPELGIYALVESLQYDTTRYECVHLLIATYILKGMNEIAFKYYECIQTYYETEYPNKSFSEKLFVSHEIPNFLMPYNMIILSYRVKRPEIAHKMYNIIFKNKYVPTNHWFLHNLFDNMEYFKTYLYPELDNYIKLCKENNYVLTHKQLQTISDIKMYSPLPQCDIRVP